MPLQKSFSDQNHSAKARVSSPHSMSRIPANIAQQQQQNRPQWNRNKSYQGQQPQNKNAPSKPLQEKPAVPVSTATKNRLSAFQFGESKAASPENTVISLLSDDDKENADLTRRGAPQIVHEEKKKTLEEQPALPDLPTTHFPSTPGSRLALPDLIGMGDIIRTVQNVSPDERIEWDYSKDNDRTSSSSFGGIRRAKKRARSSSPVISSPPLASNHFSAKGGTANPQVDPGSELWGRYSLGGSNAPTRQGPSVPALAHLMQTSSPQPSKEGTTPRSANGFRRANSCGNQFPKRRKLNGPEDGDVFTKSANIGPSRLSILIESVQEGMTQPKGSLPSTESSRSPHASAGRSSPADENSSPVHQKERREAKALAANSVPHNPQVIGKGNDSIDRSKQTPAKSDSSDYGDFDDDELDATLLEVLESNPTQPALENTKTPIPNAPTNPFPKSPRRYDILNLQPPSVKASKSPSTSKTTDEFADFDEDVFGEDLEQVLSQFDRPPPITGMNNGAKVSS
jgi:hypothetical protein